jgi:hypothetical protein
MMKAIRFLGVIFFSFEALAVLVLVIARYYWPTWFAKAFALIGTGDLKFGHVLLLLPAACIVPTYKMCDEILNPKEAAHKQLLNKWPGYPMLRTRVFASLFLVVLGAGGWLSGIIAGAMGYVVTGPQVALCGLAVTLISTGSVGWGRFRLRDALHGV